MKMKLLYWISSIALFLTPISVSSSESQSDSGVSFFDGTFEEALDQARQVELPLFLDFYIPECPPCEFMATKVYTNPSVAEFMNARFVSYKIDAYNKETNGPGLAKHYNVGSYPTYLILDHDGKEEHRATSSMSPENFVRAIGWLTGEAASPMEDHQARYAEGDRDPDFVRQYLFDSMLELSLMPKDTANWRANMEAYRKALDKYKAIMNEYLTSSPPKDLINSTDFSIIARYSAYRDDEGIEFIIDNFDAYVEATSLEGVSKFLLGIISDNAFIKAMEGDQSYVDLIDSLQEEPLERATAFERKRDPASLLLPENQRDRLAEVFSSATKQAGGEAQE